MRRSALTVIIACAVSIVPGGPALAQTGGAEGGADPGGAAYDPAAVVPRVLRPTIRAFAVTPGTLRPGAPARVRLRIDGITPKVRVRVDVVRAGATRASARINLGMQPTGRNVSRAWVPRGKPLAAGTYVARLHAVDGNGRALRRGTGARAGRATLRLVAPAAAPATPAPPPAAAPGRLFPVQGPYDLGGAGARFGAGRTGHIHQGQDITAAEGTPLVSPRAGAVYWRAYQAGGAGHYLVIRGDDGRDLVFMHLRDGSLTVSKGDAVSAGQRIAEVGNTGRSSGAHLHFEIWPNGWWAKGSSPIDPRPQLDAWATG